MKNLVCRSKRLFFWKEKMEKNYGLKIGETYRLKSSPTYGFVKIISIDENASPKIADCEHTVDKGDLFGFSKKFLLSEIIPKKV